MNYVLKSKEGKYMVLHYNHVKACSISLMIGKPFALLRNLRIVGLDGGNIGAQLENEDLNLLRRPAHLRQDIRPPLRFGDFVTH